MTTNKPNHDHAAAEAAGMPIVLNFTHCQACGTRVSTDWAFNDQNDGYTTCCNEREVGAGYCDSTCYHFGVDPVEDKPKKARKTKTVPTHDAGDYVNADGTTSDGQIAEPRRRGTSHVDCSHEMTKAGRAACRKLRARDAAKG